MRFAKGTLILTFSQGEKELLLYEMIPFDKAIRCAGLNVLEVAMCFLSHWERRTRSASEGKGVGFRGRVG